MENSNRRIKIAQKGFNGRHFLEISAYVEIIDSGEFSRVEELIFFEISPEYNRTKKIAMSIGTIDLRSLAYGAKELIKNGSSAFKKYTEPGRAGVSGKRKELSIAKDEKGQYFINLKSGEQSTGFSFDAYGFAAFADIITLMAEEIDKMIFKYQLKLLNNQRLNDVP